MTSVVLPRAKGSTARFFEHVFIAVALGAVVWFFHWTVSTSGGFGTPGDEDYYNFVVRGWRSGHLYMSKEPRPEMLLLKDPYDPAQNGELRLGDASYYRGHHYLYFGAAPAAFVMMPYYVLTGKELGTTTVLFGFCVVGFLAASALWLSVRRRYFPESAGWVGVLGILMLGLGTQVLTLLRRPLLWELPIAASFGFSMVALLAVYVSLHGRRPILALGIAGLSLGGAVASRPIVIFGAIMMLPALWEIRRTSGKIWRRGALAAGVGLGAWVVAVLAYNFARFGNALEFGQNYQLSSLYESKLQHFRAAYMAHNALIYFLHPGTWTSEFPFMMATKIPDPPTGYHTEWTEGIYGLLVTFPLLWLALATPLSWRGRPDDERRRLKATSVAVASFGLTMTVVLLGYYIATSRYMADFNPALMLLATFGWLGSERWAQPTKLNRFIAPIIALAGFFTGLAGVLISFDYHEHLLRAMRPEIWTAMEKFCAPWAHWFSRP